MLPRKQAPSKSFSCSSCLVLEFRSGLALPLFRRRLLHTILKLGERGEGARVISLGYDRVRETERETVDRNVGYRDSTAIYLD